MQTQKTLVYLIVFLLLVINFLTFHDIFEPRTLKDWLILAVSILLGFYFFKRTHSS